ncbi:PTS system sucrose-specific IIC component [Elusimicrobium posterum]|uniref:PTS transporter subunit EIIC n=1 Tax=Elusimicrobium posterum TaxID=3116653 RepID=UPI003C77F911
MEANKYTTKAEQILLLSGGKENIATVSCCMTRLRLDVNDPEVVDIAAIKKLEDIMGVAKVGTQIQVILGPGKAEKMKGVFLEVLQKAGVTNVMAEDCKPVNQNTGAVSKMQEFKQNRSEKLKHLLKSLANIFIPLIPGFIGCGLLLALNNTLNTLVPGYAGTEVSKLLAVFGGAVYTGLSIFIGMNTAKEFGGSPIIGGIMAIILTSPGLSDITLFGQKLLAARGGVIAVMLVVLFSSWLEVQMRKFIPEMFNLFLSPLIVIAVSGVLAIFVLQPAGDVIAQGIVKVVDLSLTHGGAFTGFILAGLFLPLVMLGLHQGLAPIHAQLIAEFGYTVLFPILAMAGAGQVGAAIAVLVKTKNEKLKKTIYSALPIGFFGIGEPLIYGVTLPLGKPFFTACLGGAFGGAVMAMYHVGATVIGGISGIPLVFLTTRPAMYLVGLLVAYLAGFAATMLVGFDDSQYE